VVEEFKDSTPHSEDGSHTFGQKKNKTFSFKALELLSQDGDKDTCRHFTHKLLKVMASVEGIEIALLHPAHNDYAFMTLEFGETDFNYEMHYDHDYYKGKMGKFRIFDNTDWPQTVNPAAG